MMRTFLVFSCIFMYLFICCLCVFSVFLCIFMFFSDSNWRAFFGGKKITYVKCNGSFDEVPVNLALTVRCFALDGIKWLVVVLLSAQRLFLDGGGFCFG